MVARQPLPGLTCHLSDFPGSHNPTGREAWTSGVCRVEYPGVRKLGERDTHGDTQVETDGSKAAEELKRKRVKKEKGGKREMERERKAEVGEYKETQGMKKGKTGRNIRDQEDDKTEKWG